MSVTNNYYLIKAKALLQNCKAAGIEQLSFKARKGRLDWSMVKNAIPPTSWPTVDRLLVYIFVTITLDCQ